MFHKYLGSVQNKKRIILFSQDEEHWSFPKAPNFLNLSPNDAKRVDIGEQISVLVSTHGEVYEVPYNFDGPITIAKSYRNCHSVERAPDGNLLSACSKRGVLCLHYRRKHKDGIDFLKRKKEYDLRFAHGVVYQYNDNKVWAIGNTLQEYLYMPGPDPELVLENEYPLPRPTGHDLFPTPDGHLIFTINTGIYKFNVDTKETEQISPVQAIKSAMFSVHTNELIVAQPDGNPMYKRWQTEFVTNLSQGTKLQSTGNRMYKVRLWEKNSFSYGEDRLAL